MPCCEAISEERSAGNRHATFCGSRERVTAPDDPVGLETGQALRPVPRQSFNRQLDFRNIKTTLGMEVLRCLTPQMVEKELWVNLLAYNLIRLLLAQAAVESGCQPRELSFKHTVQIWTQWTLLNSAKGQDYQRDLLFKLIAQGSALDALSHVPASEGPNPTLG